MKAIVKASQLETIFQIIQNMFNGMTVSEACKAVGMPRSTFYYFMANNPEKVAEINALLQETLSQQATLLLIGKTEMLQKLIENGLSDKYTPKSRLDFYRKLDLLLDQLIIGLQLDIGPNNGGRNPENRLGVGTS